VTDEGKSIKENMLGLYKRFFLIRCIRLAVPPSAAASVSALGGKPMPLGSLLRLTPPKGRLFTAQTALKTAPGENIFYFFVHAD
jgi:hypothetical protein